MAKVKMKSDQSIVIGDKTKVLKSGEVYNLSNVMLEQLPSESYVKARATSAKGQTSVKSAPSQRKKKGDK